MARQGQIELVAVIADRLLAWRQVAPPMVVWLVMAIDDESACGQVKVRARMLEGRFEAARNFGLQMLAVLLHPLLVQLLLVTILTIVLCRGPVAIGQLKRGAAGRRRPIGAHLDRAGSAQLAVD